jgi:hypothetical protein
MKDEKFDLILGLERFEEVEQTPDCSIFTTTTPSVAPIMPVW